MYPIGTRVKLVKPIKMEHYGMEGVITGHTFFPKGTPMIGGISTFDCDVEVLWDGQRLECNQASWQLEPIKPHPTGEEIIKMDKDLLTEFELTAPEYAYVTVPSSRMDDW
jgi:hypothetical protein